MGLVLDGQFYKRRRVLSLTAVVGIIHWFRYGSSRLFCVCNHIVSKPEVMAEMVSDVVFLRISKVSIYISSPQRLV